MDLSGFFNTLQTLAAILITQVLPGLIGAAALLFFGRIALRMAVRGIASTARRSGVKPALVDLIKATTTAVGYILIIAGVLQLLGLNQIALALGGSISLAALGIATAASGNLGDIIAGVFLASDPDFGNGFHIKSGDVEGVIEQIDLRKTRIRGLDSKLYIIPNKDIESKVWIVEARPGAQPLPPLFPRRHRPAPTPGAAPSNPPPNPPV